jgi:hypothetical protein
MQVPDSRPSCSQLVFMELQNAATTIVLCKSHLISLASDARSLPHLPSFAVNTSAVPSSIPRPRFRRQRRRVFFLNNYRSLHGVEYTDLRAAMTGFHLDPYRRAKAVRYLLLRWRPEAIAREINCSKPLYSICSEISGYMVLREGHFAVLWAALAR